MYTFYNRIKTDISFQHMQHIVYLLVVSICTIVLTEFYFIVTCLCKSNLINSSTKSLVVTVTLTNITRVIISKQQKEKKKENKKTS